MKHTHQTFEAFAVSDINPISASQTAKWADSGDVDAIWTMLRNDPSTRFKYIELMRKAARSGDPTAKYVLGYGYIFGDWPAPAICLESIGSGSPSKDLFFEGVELLKEAADEGYTPAAAALADVYLFDCPDENAITQWAWYSQKELHHELASAWRRRALLQGSPTVALNWVKSLQSRGQYNYQDILEAANVAVRNSVSEARLKVSQPIWRNWKLRQIAAR
jgi:TPR repeat protein